MKPDNPDSRAYALPPLCRILALWGRCIDHRARRFDPAELTPWTSRDLAATPDGRLAPVVLDRLDGVAAMLVRSYPQAGPFRLMSPVAALLSETARRARSAPTGERQRLVRTLAHLGVLAGHMSFDLGQTGYVDGYFGGGSGRLRAGVSCR